MFAFGCVVWSGCLLDEVGQASPEVFACNVDDECDGTEMCLLGRCYDGEPPTLEIRGPEADEIVAPRADDPPGEVRVTLGLGGSGLELLDPSDVIGSESGQGYVEIMVDGMPVTTVTQGNLVSGVAVDVTLDDRPGAHRLSARAVRTDGVRYDNAAAITDQLVWIDDGRQHVAFVRPRPGEVFPLEQTELEVEVAVLNFAFVPVTDGGPDPSGHVHVHYDDPFPACPGDPSCDCCYLAIVGPQGGERRRSQALVMLPPAAAGPGDLTAILRQTAHPAFVDVQGDYVYETIVVERRKLEIAVDASTGDQ